MNRWKAAGIHLLISIGIACVVTLFIRLAMYPDFYFYISGGVKLLLLIISVDVIVGPLLTLVVYQERKKTLKFDLGVIAVLQFVALVYGMHTMWVARPVYNVFAIDRFVIVTPAMIDPKNLEKAKSVYQQIPLFGPAWVAAEKPRNPDEQFDLIISGALGADIEVYPQYYGPFDAKKNEVAKRSKPISELRGKSQAASALIDAFLKEHKGQVADYRYLPLKGFSPESMSMIVTVDGTPVTALAIDPW